MQVNFDWATSNGPGTFNSFSGAVNETHPVGNSESIERAWVKLGGFLPLHTGGRLRSFHIVRELFSYGSRTSPEQFSTVEQSKLIRHIFGNPFRPVVFGPAWRTPSVLAVAQTIYAERRFGDLPILADALEEAGCNDPSILTHFRTGGEHVRGCFALDLVLAKE